jgi:hypothetical protein
VSCQAKPSRVYVHLRLVERETARRRVSHQSLVASALLRVAGFVLGRSGSAGHAKILTPVLRPQVFPELQKAGVGGITGD